MRLFVTTMLLLALVGGAYAELQNVTIGGQMEVRLRWYNNAFTSGVAPNANPVPAQRIPGVFMPGRATGQAGNGVLSLWRYDNRGNDFSFAEQATSLNVKAEFTDNVCAFIELYSFDQWGDTRGGDFDFRSWNWITGADARATTTNDVEILQGFVEVNDMFGQPLRLRVGRQVMQFGKDLGCFLVAGKTTPTDRYAFDGIRLTSTPVDNLTVDAWAMKLVERSPIEQDGDVDFYGVYGTYKGWEALSLSLYWMFLRDARAINDTTWQANGVWTDKVLERVWGVDNYDVSNLHTVGFQATGKYEAWDYNLQVAYQFGDAGQLGTTFRNQIGAPRVLFGGWGPLGANVYGDDSANYDNWGGEFSVGYTFDTKWNIRPYVSGCYFEGQDNRDISFLEWLSPFNKPQASVSFNRLFSDTNYAPVINDNGDMSNFYQINLGVTMTPTEKTWVMLRANQTWADKTFEWPAYVKLGPWRVPIAPNLPWWTMESSNDLGISTEMIAKYNYSKDLTFLLYYGHLFTGEGLADGSYMNRNGTMFNGGSSDKDANYVFLWSILKF